MRKLLPVWLTMPCDLYWAWGNEGTRYYLRVLTLTVPLWRTSGAPYGMRRFLKPDPPSTHTRNALSTPVESSPDRTTHEAQNGGPDV